MSPSECKIANTASYHRLSAAIRGYHLSMFAWRRASHEGRAHSPIISLACSAGLFSILCLATVVAPAQTQPPSNGFVGSAACKTCHADVWAGFYKNPHYQSVAAGDRPPEQTGCESCHGPGQDHIAAKGGKATIKHAFSLMPP